MRHGVMGIAASLSVGLALGCGNGTGSTAQTSTAADGAVTCLVGASAADCAKCTYDADRCEVACPTAGDSIPWPTPPQYQHACSTHSCCMCQFDSWQSSFLRCETSCDALVRQWHDIVATPQVVACQGKWDCEVVSEVMSCNCTPSIGGCGKAVNGAAYGASGAPALESMFTRSCSAPAVCDCGSVPGFDCVGGVCTITSFPNCFPPPLPDAPP